MDDFLLGYFMAVDAVPRYFDGGAVWYIVDESVAIINMKMGKRNARGFIVNA